ncbi:MAG TPA: hypothetical protein DCZ94_13910 [Lentisphaeria bacterium]|nr:MAG: hypothetical protein A2X48_03730 [Lentisphaerae bacterium GWF2_49_21]HBC88040.1 hypothetical protein [Lentisphaeria bacterium]
MSEIMKISGFQHSRRGIGRSCKPMYFNLIELTIAIGVVGIGFTGIISLFPEALKTTRDAIGENYSSYVANQFLIYIARSCNDPTNNYQGNTKDFWEEYIYPADTLPIPESCPTGADETAATFATSAEEGGIYTSDNPGIYRVRQGTSNLVDYQATIRIWKSTIKNMYIYNQNYSEIGYEYAVNLNIEISWPSEKPYGNREKRYYMMEIFRQQF